MQLTRKVFLKISGIALVGSGFGEVPFASATTLLEPWIAPTSERTCERSQPLVRDKAATATSVRDTGAAAFRPHVNTPFALRVDGRDVRAVLTHVTEHAVDPSLEQFSLLFAVPADAGIVAGIHRLEHAGVEPLDLFLAPVGGPGGRHLVFEACFSRPVDGRTRDLVWPTSI
jgi:hypothetical protein